jgi:hypothetical protein
MTDGTCIIGLTKRRDIGTNKYPILCAQPLDYQHSPWTINPIQDPS